MKKSILKSMVVVMAVLTMASVAAADNGDIKIFDKNLSISFVNGVNNGTVTAGGLITYKGIGIDGYGSAKNSGGDLHINAIEFAKNFTSALDSNSGLFGVKGLDVYGEIGFENYKKTVDRPVPGTMINDPNFHSADPFAIAPQIPAPAYPTEMVCTTLDPNCSAGYAVDQKTYEKKENRLAGGGGLNYAIPGTYLIAGAGYHTAKGYTISLGVKF